MPNLIHSLDGTTLTLLFDKFCNFFYEPQFYSVHDCFGTTCDKVDVLKILLASIYIDLYSSEPYKFDQDIFNYLTSNNITVNRVKRTVNIPD